MTLSDSIGYAPFLEFKWTGFDDNGNCQMLANLLMSDTVNEDVVIRGFTHSVLKPEFEDLQEYIGGLSKADWEKHYMSLHPSCRPPETKNIF